MGSCVNVLAGKADNLEDSARQGDEAIGLLIDIMNKARTEPNFQAREFSETITLCRKVLWERISLCQRHFIEVSRAKAVINPLKALFLRVESIRLEDPGTFGTPTLYPCHYDDGWNSFSISLYPSFEAKYRRLIIRFMDDLGSARNALYAERRSTMELERDIPVGDTRIETSYDGNRPDVENNRDAWPYEVTADSFKGLSLERDAPCLYNFLHKVWIWILIAL
jgi:hypothetical protein